MPEALSLEEIKAENTAEAEAEAPPPEPESPDTEAAAEGEQPEQEPVVEPEEWMKTAEVPVKTHIGMKTRLKAKIGKKDDEIAELRAQIEELKPSASAAPQATSLERPKKSDFYGSDDPDESYLEALSDFKMAQMANHLQTQRRRSYQQQRMEQAQTEISSAVDDHYQRASNLLAASGISEDLYRSADMVVRSAIDSVTGSGDQVTDQIISRMGEGSEKVMYYLGQNPAALEKLKGALSQDPSGLKAAVFLGRLQSDVGAPKKRTSNAPPPAARIQGDAVVGETANAKALRKKYTDAHKKGDSQAAYMIRKEARQSKIKTSDW